MKKKEISKKEGKDDGMQGQEGGEKGEDGGAKVGRGETLEGETLEGDEGDCDMRVWRYSVKVNHFITGTLLRPHLQA